MGMLKTIFGADTSQLKKGTDQARAKVERFSRGVKRQMAAAFSVTAITYFFRNLTNRLDRVGKLAARGFSTDFIQDLGQTAELAGSSVEALIPKILQMYREINNAEQPTRQMQMALDSLGLEFRELQGLSPEQLFNRVVSGLQEADDKGRAAAGAMTLLRDRSGELLPVLQQLVDNGMSESNKATAEAIRAAELWNDTLTVLGNNITMTFAPALQYLVKGFAHLKAFIEVSFTAIQTFTQTVAQSVMFMVRAADRLLKLDFEGFTNEIERNAQRMGIIFDTFRESVNLAGNDLAKLREQMEKPIKPPTIQNILEPLEEAEQKTGAQRVQAMTLADSLQRIGGGGASAVAMQRDESIRIADRQLDELMGIRSAIEQLEAERMQ